MAWAAEREAVEAMFPEAAVGELGVVWAPPGRPGIELEVRARLQ